MSSSIDDAVIKRPWIIYSVAIISWVVFICTTDIGEPFPQKIIYLLLALIAPYLFYLAIRIEDTTMYANQMMKKDYQMDLPIPSLKQVFFMTTATLMWGAFVVKVPHHPVLHDSFMRDVFGILSPIMLCSAIWIFIRDNYFWLFCRNYDEPSENKRRYSSSFVFKIVLSILVLGTVIWTPFIQQAPPSVRGFWFWLHFRSASAAPFLLVCSVFVKYWSEIVTTKILKRQLYRGQV